jgi:cbb3-type cytochrome oxidase subunit 3
MTTGLIGLLTFLLGLILGNWLAIGRDKRKEFNDAAAPVRAWLLKVKDDPSPSASWPTDQQRDLFVSCLPWWRRRSFRQHWEAYREAHHAALNQDPSTGDTSYNRNSIVKRELAALFRFTNRQ